MAPQFNNNEFLMGYTSLIKFGLLTENTKFLCCPQHLNYQREFVWAVRLSKIEVLSVLQFSNKLWNFL